MLVILVDPAEIILNILLRAMHDRRLLWLWEIAAPRIQLILLSHGRIDWINYWGWSLVLSTFGVDAAVFWHLTIIILAEFWTMFTGTVAKSRVIFHRIYIKMVSLCISQIIVDILIFSDNLNGIILFFRAIELRVDVPKILIIEQLVAIFVEIPFFRRRDGLLLRLIHI